ncbi:MAG: ubiquinol-cytochrome c reductase iron-sulfur subunit [Acidimicrobiia bacterium]
MADVEGRFDGLSSRRRFLRDGLAGVVAFIAVGCSPSRTKPLARKSVPTTTQASDLFGARMDVGTVDAIRSSIADIHMPRYIPEARAYVGAFPSELAARARPVYPAEVVPLLDAGLVVLSQKCPHLGCRVPFCETSQWFECPCHAARFDRIGEYRQGPAPAGMSLVDASIVHGRLIIDTGTTFPGAPIGTNTTRQEPAGPFCV